MDTTNDRSCLSCEKTLTHSMSFPVKGVKNVYFCGDHFQLGATYFCTPCAGQLTRLNNTSRVDAQE